MTVSKPFLDPKQLDGSSIRLGEERDGLSSSVHVFDARSVDAINAALGAKRPLLVRGRPGTGKSQLARAAAVALNRAFVHHTVDGRTETRDLLFTVNSIARLATAQVMGALKSVSEEELEARVSIDRFLRPGPLWWAFDWGSATARAAATKAKPPRVPEGWEAGHGVVVLIDEIDKADSAVPNGLLDALGHRYFDVDEWGAVTLDGKNPPPLIVITTNDERALPDAFIRRCFVLHIELPGERPELVEFLRQRGRAHFDDSRKTTDELLLKAANLLADDRLNVDGDALLRPGLAEYLDLLYAVTEQETDPARQSELLQRIADFALKKHAGDYLA